MNNKDASRRVLWMFIAFAVTFLRTIAWKILLFLATPYEVDGEREVRAEWAYKLVVNHGKALECITLICALLLTLCLILFGKYSQGVFKTGLLYAVYVLVLGCNILTSGNRNLATGVKNLLDTAGILAVLVYLASFLLYTHSMKKHVAAVREKQKVLWKCAFLLAVVFVVFNMAYRILYIVRAVVVSNYRVQTTSLLVYEETVNTGGRKVLTTVTRVAGIAETVAFLCLMLWILICLWLLYRAWKKRTSEPKAEKKTEPAVLSLELTDTEWPAAEITHDRNIARGIVYDGEGYFYFVHVDRDDAFGKATVIETPGGGVEEGEDLATAIHRELSEELGADVDVIGKIALISDYYNVIGRHNLSNYFLCKVRSFGEKHLTKDEIEDFHLQTMRLTYEEALAEYEKNREYPFGRLVANREVPVLQWAKQWIEKD